MNKQISRRTMLRGAGVALSLPCLEAMIPTTALAQTGALNLPPRAAFLAYRHRYEHARVLSQGRR